MGPNESTPDVRLVIAYSKYKHKAELVKPGHRLYPAWQYAKKRARKKEPNYLWAKLLAYESYSFTKDTNEAEAEIVHSHEGGFIFVNHWWVGRAKRAGVFRSWMEDLFLHEIAHAIACHRDGYSIQAHGKEWRRVAKELGCVPRARVSYHDRLLSRAHRKIEDLKEAKYGTGLTPNSDSPGPPE
jgi:hypothetical protein